jgi:hypothetical protein
MRRDWELIRNILQELERADASARGVDDTAFTGYPPDVVAYHFHILHQAGLLEAKCVENNEGVLFGWAERLTWNGHELLDYVRHKNVWERVKREIEAKGLDLSLHGIFAVAQRATGDVLDGPA